MTASANRVEQGLRALFAFATPLESQLARHFLSPAEYAAFKMMSRADQLHSLNVLRAVLRQYGSTPRPLATAALMHDVGKSRYHMSLWQKTLATLVTRFLPSLADFLGRSESLNPLRAPFTVSRNHPQWSADIMRQCKSDALAIWLTERHQQQPDALNDHNHLELLRRLQLADEAC